MMHKAWSSIEEVHYCFSMSSVKFQGHAAKNKSSNLTQIGRFRTVTPVWIHWWLWSVVQSSKQQRRDALLFSKVIHQFQGHTGQNITDFDPNWAFPDYRPVAAFKSLRFALFPDIWLNVFTVVSAEIIIHVKVWYLHFQEMYLILD